MRLRFGRVASTTSISGKKEIKTRSTSRDSNPMQNAINSVLPLAGMFAIAGGLAAMAASYSRHYLAFKIFRAISRFGFFLASFLLTLLPFVIGWIEPNHASEPIVVIGLIGSMTIAYYATQAQIRWHDNRRSPSED